MPIVGVQKKRRKYSAYIVLSVVKGLCIIREKKERCRDKSRKIQKKRKWQVIKRTRVVRETKRKQEKDRKGQKVGKGHTLAGEEIRMT